jgi:hypothetical protein
MVAVFVPSGLVWRQVKVDRMSTWTDVLNKSPGGYVEPAGMIFVIRCTPDIFTGERINVGVCAIDAQGKRKGKVVTEPMRLQCLYGDQAINVLLLAQAALEAAEIGAPSPSPQITFDDPSPYFNSTLVQAVENTFADQVTVALPHRDNPLREEMPDEVAQAKVANAVKDRIGLDFELLANTPQVVINTERGPRTMTIPLQPRNGVGTIRSAFYNPNTLRTHLLDSVLDLECAARFRQKRALGLFILRPGKASRKDQGAIDSVIDNVAYRCPKNLYLGVSDDERALAEEITEWGVEAS